MLDNIVYFLRLYETKSFKNCAELLEIQPSTLSKHIAELEVKLEKQLIIRTSKRFEITHFGEYIYTQFRHLPVFTDNVLSVYNKNQKQNKYAGTLNVTMGIVISYELICPYISAFSKKYPKVKLNINFISSRLSEWPANSPDIVLSSWYIKGYNLNNRFVRREYAKLYCTSGYALKYGIPDVIGDLAEHSVLGFLDENLSPLAYAKMKNIYTKEEYLIDLSNSQVNVNSPIHLKQIAINSESIFGSLDSMIRKELDSGELLPVLPNWVLQYNEFYLTSKKQISDEAQLFIDFIYECMRV